MNSLRNADHTSRRKGGNVYIDILNLFENDVTLADDGGESAVVARCLHLHEMEIGHLCLFVPREPSVPANSPGRNKKAFFFSSIFFSCGRNTSLTSDYAHCTKLKYISSFKRKRNNTVMLMYSKQNLFFTAKHWGGVCVCGGGVSKCL